MRDDRFLDRAGADQPADAEIGLCGVVGDDGELAPPGVDQRLDDAMRAADAHEAADHQRGAVGDQRGHFRRSQALFHGDPTP